MQTQVIYYYCCVWLHCLELIALNFSLMLQLPSTKFSNQIVKKFHDGLIFAEIQATAYNRATCSIASFNDYTRSVLNLVKYLLLTFVKFKKENRFRGKQISKDFFKEVFLRKSISVRQCCS